MIDFAKMKNQRMLEKLKSGETIDLSDCPRKGGFYVLEGHTFTQFVILSERASGIDLCDAVTEQWIWSVGKDRQTGEILASTGTDFYESPRYECLWLR